MKTMHPTSQPQSPENRPSPEGPVQAISIRLNSVHESIIQAEAAMRAASQSEAHPDMARLAMRVYPTRQGFESDANSKEAEQPVIPEATPTPVNQPNILEGEQGGINPILQQAYVDKLARTTEELNHDIQEASN